MTHVLKGAAAQSSGQTRLPARGAASAAVPAALPAAPVPPASPSPHSAARPTQGSGIAAEPAPAHGMSEAELQAMRDEAREAGFAQGLREAKQQAAEALARQASAWTAAIGALEANVERKLHDVESFAVAMAFEACARVLGDAALDGAQVAAVVRRLLADARETALLRVQLSPADIEAVQGAVRSDPHWQHRHLSFEVDPMLGAGECRVASTHGQLETSLPVQLDVIRQSLLATFADRARARSA